MKHTALLFGLPVALLAIFSVASSAGAGPTSSPGDRRGSSSSASERPVPHSVPYKANIVDAARENTAYRRVLFTGKHSQLVAMSIPAGEDIGTEKHARVEQTFFIVSGAGRLVLDGAQSSIGPGDTVVVPPGIQHDIIATGQEPLKLYTIYTPPNHIDGRVQATKADAEKDVEDKQFESGVE